MTDYPQQDPDGDPMRPFAQPEVTGMREPETIDRESLSLGGMLAWLTIAVAVVAMITLTAFSRSSQESRTEASDSDLFPVQMQARTLVGQKSFMPGSGSSKTEDDDGDEEGTDEGVDEDESGDSSAKSGAPIPSALNDGTYEQRLCYVLMVNENQGPGEAAEKLGELDESVDEAGFELNEDQARLRGIVGSLIESHLRGDFDAEPVVISDREFLREKLGWIGELALVPEGASDAESRRKLLKDAKWSMGLMMGAVLLLLLTVMAGVALAAVFSVFFATGKLKPTFLTHGKSVNIYVETFALWIVFFFGGPQLTAMAIAWSGVEITALVNMGISAGFFFGSLIVLVYPLMRGISFKQLCSDIGWKTKGSFTDLLISPITYIAGTPLMMAGMFCVLILTVFAGLLAGPKPFGTSVAPGHPIQDMIAGGQWMSMAYVVLMACVAAPVVEETMFRGVLYRHLRELSGSWARWGSVIFSALFNGLIFAAIHPQGFVAIPLLTALAINFSLAREWRDSLVAPIIMHAINNGAVTTFMLLMMS